VTPSGPGAPRFALTRFQAASMLASSTTLSISENEVESKADFSVAADVEGLVGVFCAASRGRDAFGAFEVTVGSFLVK
jgi:hypothetical protein